MIDINKLKYGLIIITESGKQIDITSAAIDIGWEEGDAELATRIYFTLHNTLCGGIYLSSLAKLGCIVIINANWGTGSADEVARGYIEEWEPVRSGSAATMLNITAYDGLFKLHQSQDNRYYAAGTGTKAALMAIFNDWGIPVGEYKGPDVSHAKTLFKSEHLSDILLQLLDDAAKKGAPKCIIRASKGQVQILPRGSNEVIYHFDGNANVTLSRDKISTANLVTRVKVVGKEDGEGRQPIEAVLDGKTEYGIRQRIRIRVEDDSLATAKLAAQDVLDELGKPSRATTVESPDVPTIRKGDKISILASSLNGYFIVKSVRHNATSKSMTMDLEPIV